VCGVITLSGLRDFQSSIPVPFLYCKEGSLPENLQCSSDKSISAPGNGAMTLQMKLACQISMPVCGKSIESHYLVSGLPRIRKKWLKRTTRQVIAGVKFLCSDSF